MTLLADPPVAPATARPVTASQVTDAVLDGVWVVDVREEAAERTDTGQTEPDQVGWLVPWEDDIVLLTGSPEVLSTRHDSPWR